MNERDDEFYETLDEDLELLMDANVLPFVWHRQRRLCMLNDDWLKRFDLSSGQSINDEQYIEIAIWILDTYVNSQTIH